MKRAKHQSNGKTPISIFLDLSKAFDTLNHDILLSKLKFYGINDTCLNWFKSYLYDRSQYVEIDHVKSSTNPISVGVPQGSILGPLLFNIYINDINKSTNFFSFIKYADDTNLLNSNSNKSVDINEELTKVYHWLCSNRLSLNISKTKYMIFHTKGKKTDNIFPIIQLQNTPILKVSEFNFLGVTLDEKLNWNSHIDKISCKVSRCIGMICKLKHFLPLHILKTLYTSLILPYFHYGILAWGMFSSRLFKFQKKAVRTVTNSKYNAHTDPLFKSLNLIKIDDIYILNILKFYFKHCHNLLPAFFQGFLFKQRSDLHNYDTRTKSKLNINKTKTKQSEYLLRNITAKIVNEAPDCIIDKIYTHSLQGFSYYIRRYYINSYNQVCTIDNCYTCMNT